MNAHSPNIPLGSLANEQREANLFAAAQNALDVRRGIKRDNREAVLAALRELPTASALWVIETFAVKDLSDLGYGYERICDGIAEYRSDLADEAVI